HVECRRADMVDPPVLRFFAGFGGTGSTHQRLPDHVSDVVTLSIECFGRGGIETALIKTHEEQIRKAATHHSVERLVVVRPVLVERQSVTPFNDIDTPPSIQIARDFETARENHAIDRMLDTQRNETVLSHALDALSFRDVDELHICSIERR